MLPEPSGDHTTQTSAEPELVLFDEITGEPELKPKASGEVPTRLKVGLPLPSSPYLNAFSTPVEPPAVLPADAVVT